MQLDVLGLFTIYSLSCSSYKTGTGKDANRRIAMALRVHHVPGRIRLYLPWLKGNAAGAREIQERVSKMRGVLSVEARALTGSVLMYYEPGVARVVDLIGSATQATEWKDTPQRSYTAAMQTTPAHSLCDIAWKAVAELALSAALGAIF